MQLTKFKGNTLKVTADIAPKVEKNVQFMWWGGTNLSPPPYHTKELYLH